MSPERGCGERLEGRSDIYALGVVIFELFTGDVPFRGETPVATLLKHIEDPPPIRAAQAARLPPPLIRSSKGPSRSLERFRSARELADVLQVSHRRSPWISKDEGIRRKK